MKQDQGADIDPKWPDCHEVQCEQAHAVYRAIFQYLGVECPENVYNVGKMLRLMEAVKILAEPPYKKSDLETKGDGRTHCAIGITAEQFVRYWDNLDFKQHCLLAAQSLLKAASLVK